MMKFLFLAGLLATSLVLVLIAIRTIRRRPLLHSGAPAGQLGSVSQHWLTTHRAER
jgi:hypothetical protein